MKKQNVKLTLLASLLTGLLSQGAQAVTSSGATIILSAEVAKTTCNVSPVPNSGANSGVNLQDLGIFRKADMLAGDSKKVGIKTYSLLPASTAPLVLTVSGCNGDDMATGGAMEMSVRGNSALDNDDPTTNMDLYGDPNSDRGYGFALGYETTDNSPVSVKNNNALTAGDMSGWILPSAGKVVLYEAKQAAAPGDLSKLDLSVKIVPQIATWATQAAAIAPGQLDTNVTFSVAMN
ncbi:hypothetical protein [Enterobacter ludwigii]